MDFMKKVTQSQINNIEDRVSSDILAILNNSCSATQAVNELEAQTYEMNLSQPDGVVVLFEDVKNKYDDLYTSMAYCTDKNEQNKLCEELLNMESQHPELLNPNMIEEKKVAEAQVKVAHNVAKAETDKLYFENWHERQPVTHQQLFDNFGVPDNLETLIIEQAEKAIKNPPKEFKKAKERSANDPKQKARFVASEKLYYSKNTTECNGEILNYKVVGQAVDWGRLIYEEGDTPEFNMLKLRTFVTQAVRDYYGGFSRIKNIVVRSEMLIINGVAFSPIIDEKYLKDARLFPIDTLDYIRDGRVAPLFHWKYLRSTHNLVLLDIDDVNFYLSDIASDIGVGRRAGLSTIFKYVKSLEVFIIGGEKVCVDEQNDETGKAVKKKLSIFKHFKNYEDGYKFSILNGTNSLQAYTVNNFKNYANNRGDKGFLKFATGIIGRGALASVGLGINGVAHLAKGIFETVKDVWRESITPVDLDDVTG